MSISADLNSVGLILDLLGAGLIWRFGLPAELSRSGTQYRAIEGTDADEIAKAKKFDRLSSWGFLSLIVGFALQLASNFLGRSTAAALTTRIEWSTALRDPFMVVFTAAIAVSTAAYTIITLRLWRTTKDSVDVARYNAFMAYMTTLASQIEKAQTSDPSAAKTLEALSTVVADIAVRRFLKDVDFTTDQEAGEDFKRVANVLRSHGVDLTTVPGVGDVLRRMT